MGGATRARQEQGHCRSSRCLPPAQRDGCWLRRAIQIYIYGYACMGLACLVNLFTSLAKVRQRARNIWLASEKCDIHRGHVLRACLFLQFIVHQPRATRARTSHPPLVAPLAMASVEPSSPRAVPRFSDNASLSQVATVARETLVWRPPHAVSARADGVHRRQRQANQPSPVLTTSCSCFLHYCFDLATLWKSTLRAITLTRCRSRYPA
jgi:hypothetical protein